jgi:hypothetical protein
MPGCTPATARTSRDWRTILRSCLCDPIMRTTGIRSRGAGSGVL